MGPVYAARVRAVKRHAAAPYSAALAFLTLTLILALLGVPRSLWAAELAPATTASCAPALDAAWRVYHQAFAALAGGHRPEARALLARVTAEHPGHPAADLAAALLAHELLQPPSTGLRNEGTSGGARAELVALQSLDGLFVGLEIVLATRASDARVIASGLTGGFALGFGLALVATDDGITPGHALALNDGTLWGAWNAGASLILAHPPDAGTIAPLIMIAGQLGGLGLGEVAHRQFAPGAGDVSLATSIGLWAGTAAVLIHGIANFSAGNDATLATVLTAGDLGLLGGALLTQKWAISRGHALVLDAGAAVGTALGLGLDVLIEGGQHQAAPFYTLGLVGLAAGIGSTAYLTRNWDSDAATLGLMPYVVPASPGTSGSASGFSAGLAGRF